MIPIALTIAGSDSGGGAGIQADLKTFHRFGVYGTSAIAAVTAQNTLGVQRWLALAPEMVRAQIDSVATDLRPSAIKSGMLGDASVVRMTAQAIRDHSLGPFVLDPVMVASSGDLLLEPDAVNALRDELVPLATIVTPNLDEAEVFLGWAVRDVEAMERAARALVRDHWAGAALVKGGHLSGDRTVDVLFDGRELRRFEHERLTTRNTHGTGCTLSAAMAAQLAHGSSLLDALRRSLDWVHLAIATAPGLGAGHGPLNHFA